MMLKNNFYIFVTALFFSSCQELNINKEVNYTLLLDSLVLHQNELLKEIDTAKLNDCLKKTNERLSLFELEDLNNFQKQWLYHEKIGYQKIKSNLTHFNIRLDSLANDLAFSQKQIAALKDDLIHRHLSKRKFATYVKEEQKILGKLNAKSEELRTSFGNNITQFDSLEAKLKGIFIQLNAIQNPHETSATN
jgi:hypothetical protein